MPNPQEYKKNNTIKFYKPLCIKPSGTRDLIFNFFRNPNGRRTKNDIGKTISFTSGKMYENALFAPLHDVRV